MCISLHVGVFKFNVSWSVRASSYIPISRPTDATCDRFLSSTYMCITQHVSSFKRSSSCVPHRTYSLQFLCLCLRHCLVRNCFLQDSAADRHKHSNWRLYVRCGTPDDERLTLETCRVIHIQIEDKNLSQVASVGLLIGIYEDSRTDKETLNRVTSQPPVNFLYGLSSKI
jgi:hypothetical protein